MKIIRKDLARIWQSWCDLPVKRKLLLAACAGVVISVPGCIWQTNKDMNGREKAEKSAISAYLKRCSPRFSEVAENGALRILHCQSPQATLAVRSYDHIGKAQIVLVSRGSVTLPGGYKGEPVYLSEGRYIEYKAPRPAR